FGSKKHGGGSRKAPHMFGTASSWWSGCHCEATTDRQQQADEDEPSHYGEAATPRCVIIFYCESQNRLPRTPPPAQNFFPKNLRRQTHQFRFYSFVLIRGVSTYVERPSAT